MTQLVEGGKRFNDTFFMKMPHYKDKKELNQQLCHFRYCMISFICISYKSQNQKNRVEWWLP